VFGLNQAVEACPTGKVGGGILACADSPGGTILAGLRRIIDACLFTAFFALKNSTIVQKNLASITHPSYDVHHLDRLAPIKQ
jgi:hypothetical protein